MKQMDFDTFLSDAYEGLEDFQNHFIEEYKINNYNSWYYDQPSGVFTFSNESEEVFFSFQCIGTFSPESQTWLWSWANNNTYPNVKIDAEKIRIFGEQNNYAKLAESKWAAEEVDGWEMLAVAYKILQPIGLYRIHTEGILMFLIFTGTISKDEAQSRKESSQKLVDCGSHGLRRPAFICQHLDKFTKRGFNEAFETYENMELSADDDFQGWCDDCEKIRIKYNGWNDESMKFANIKLVCEKCYFEMKKANG